MPEYLAPGVYIEEISIGSRPIEGVSTSTVGFVGMTESGPLNKPTLVTSFAEYQRIFGGYLGEDAFNDKNKHCRFLPYAVEGFFANGGQRAYISRAADLSKAQKASAYLPSIAGYTTLLVEDIKAGDITLKVEDTTMMGMEDIFLLKDGSTSEFLSFKGPVKVVRLGSNLKRDLKKDVDKIVKLKIISAPQYEVTSDVKAKEDEIHLDTVENLEKDAPLKINDEANPEICVIKEIKDDTKSITVQMPLKFNHSKDTIVNMLSPASNDPINIASSVKATQAAVPIDSGDNIIGSGDYIQIGGDFYLVESTDSDRMLLVAEELRYDHKKNTEIKQLVPVIEAKAVNEGAWGNRIKIVIKESSISKAKLTSDAPSGQSYLDLNTVIGIEKGTILKLPVDQPKYAQVKEVINSGNLTRVYLKEPLISPLNLDSEVSTVEFNLAARYTTRYDRIDEVFKNLSLNADHGRYLEKVITPKTSNLITVKDVSKDSISEKIPMPTADNEPGWSLREGNDGIPSTSEDIDAIYMGDSNLEPTKRTGLHTLENKDDISIVAIPGISSQNLQSELITHCELMKDRFAVLDSIEGTDLEGIQIQRNLYSSEYAALYYPWISVFDPLTKQQINIPPSGHICGVFARSDNERGVHKAPANEIVRGALDLEEISGGRRAIITKGQQDVLNPKGINCIRAFPGRGILVWGARTISSDSSWKYVNVRRLFIFIEKSIELGTQWVVFEPNDEKLWARVRQTISQFLTTVWRDGALMGSTQDEAFFVRCDRTTMTQDDIDNGRLIILIGIAPVKPAEFVIFRIAQVAKGSEILE